MNDKEMETLGSALMESIRSRELHEIDQDIAKVTYDNFLTEVLIKDIPIVNTIVRLGKFAITVRDYLLLRKIFVSVVLHF
jgi:hypothetical protein